MAEFWHLYISWAECMHFLSRMGWSAQKIYNNALIYDSTRHDIMFNGEKLF